MFVAAPWAVIINSDNLKGMTDDIVQHVQVAVRNAQPTPHRVFTICQHVRYQRILPLLQAAGITVLFTPHAASDTADEYLREFGVTIVAFPHFAVHGIESAKQKDLLYSFVGQSDHPTRTVIFNTLRSIPQETMIVRRERFNFQIDDAEQQKLEKDQYQNLMARSRYALTPRGVGPSTLRFWEALQAGAIPVVAADIMILPTNFHVRNEQDWKKCIIWIRESDVGHVDAMIRAVATVQQNELVRRQHCLDIFASFAAENFVSSVRAFFE
jgi:hypothetical protein